MLDKYQEFRDYALTTGGKVPDEIIEKAELRLQNFKQVRSEIDDEVVQVLEVLTSLAQRIKDNLQTDDNPEGVLELPEEEYLSCLDVRHRDLDEILRSGEEKCAEDLVKAHGVARMMQESLQKLINEQQ